MREIAKSGKWQSPDILSKHKIPLKNKSNKSEKRGETQLDVDRDETAAKQENSARSIACEARPTRHLKIIYNF